MRGVFPFGEVHVWNRGHFPKFEGRTEDEIRCRTGHISNKAGKYGFGHPPPYVQVANCAILFGLRANAGREEAKNSLAFFQERIRDLEVKSHHVQIPDNRVAFGSKVVIRENGYDQEEAYTIVGSTETDPSNGRISNESPIGKALIGRMAGELVRVQVPAGEIEFEIIRVEC